MLFLEFNKQWGLKNIGQFIGDKNDVGQNGISGTDIKIELAWEFVQSVVGNTPSYIKVAVIDDGVERHKDLCYANGQSKLGDGYTANGNGTGRPVAKSGHGQNCAGIIAAQPNNEIGIAGVAPNVEIIPIRVFKNELVKSWQCFSIISM